jgi:lysophospholipase L1-like esterase
MNRLLRNKKQVVAAVVVLATGVLCNPVVLVWAFSDSVGASLSPASLVFLLIFDFMCALIFLYLLAPEASRWKRRFLFSFVLFCLLLLSTEALLHILLRVFPNLLPERSSEPRINQSPYAGKEWADTLFSELERIRCDFDPVVMFTRRNIQGLWVNLDSEGARKTWNPPIEDSSTAVRQIYLFGGSVAFGWGSRDDYTIPSCLSRILHEKSSRHYRVRNYGQPGYVFQQELLKLLMLLRDGHRPDIVIFFHGANDISELSLSGKVGVNEYAEIIRNKVRQDDSGFLMPTLQRIQYGLKTYSRIYRSLDYIGTESQMRYTMRPTDRMSDPELHALVGQFTSDYIKTLNVLRHLSRGYHFQSYCLWQPLLCMDPTPTAEEWDTQRFPVLTNPTFRRLRTIIRDQLCADAGEGFYDFSNSLAGRTQTMYIDLGHLTEEGNRMVAENIYELLIQNGPDQDDTSAVP